MRIVVDTNVLLREFLADDPAEAEMARAALREAGVIVVSLVCLSEFVWVTRRLYKIGDRHIASAIRTLVSDPRVEIDRPLVAHGLALLEKGGDFADGLIACSGGEHATFITFDRQAARLVAESGTTTRLLQKPAP